MRASLWLTAKGTGDRLASKEPVVFEPMPQPDEAFPTVMVDPSKAFQAIEGFGGALTDAAAETFAKLPKERQRELLEAYFDPVKGIGYSLAPHPHQQLRLLERELRLRRARRRRPRDASASPPTAASACPSSRPRSPPPAGP